MFNNIKLISKKNQVEMALAIYIKRLAEDKRLRDEDII